MVCYTIIKCNLLWKLIKFKCLFPLSLISFSLFFISWEEIFKKHFSYSIINHLVSSPLVLICPLPIISTGKKVEEFPIVLHSYILKSYYLPSIHFLFFSNGISTENWKLKDRKDVCFFIPACKVGEELDVIVNNIGNGNGDPSSIPGQDCWCFTLH